ncbi:MAG: FAD-dependent oxidoreductase [Planctomycetaceae bacterium]|jgi:ribulose 1,5-bisphosphate synthetase/thiazole synthase|nr:FAD-dependent oxidoreductase [Planctomycetaceae bacterium]
MKRLLLMLLFCFQVVLVSAQDKYVTISERQIPIAYEVDVLVIGGSTGNVAAAIESQKAGAKTMLITQYPYLGEDMTATLNLWLEPNEKLDDPLAAAIFNDPNRGQPIPPALLILQANNRIPFTYKIEQPADKTHPETNQKNRLADGLAADPVTQSLQINSNATIVLDLKKSQNVGIVSLFGFHRRDEFVMDHVRVSASDDEKTWNELPNAVLKTAHLRGYDSVDEFRLELDKPITARYLKLEIKKSEKAKRLLLGEIVVLPDKSAIPVPKAWNADGKSPYTHPAPRPMHVKMTLDKALLDAGVQFLYSTYTIGELRDEQKNHAYGAIINNRAGKQAILAKKILSTPNFFEPNFEPNSFVSGLIQLSKGTFSGDMTAQYVVIGGEPKQPEQIDLTKFPLLKNFSYEIMGEPFYGQPAKGTNISVYPIIRYTFDISNETGKRYFNSDPYFNGDLKLQNELETQIRLATFDPNQQFTADRILVSMPEFKEYGTIEFIEKSKAAGQQAAEDAKKIDKISPELLTASLISTGNNLPQEVSGEIKESLSNVKAYKEPLGFVKQQEQKIPVIGEYDVVVVGGGTTGAPAGISAARQGAKTLVLEYLHDLGGVGTAGAISIYYWGNRVGFCKEVEDGKASWNIEQRIFWWRSKLAEAGADIWYGVLGSGAVVETVNGTPTVKGVLITTQFGPRIVLAKVVIDATGHGGIAENAGAPMKYVDDKEIATQGHGLPPRNLGASYTNTDYMYVDESDMEDVTHVFIYGKEKFPKAFDFGKILDTRERPQIIGDFTFTVLDQVNKRTYPDTIVRSKSNFDTHGYTLTPYLEIEHLHHDGHFCDIPMRSCLPQGLEGIFVGGLATSCHRDAIPIIRMQPDLQNQGYALGCLAAKAVKDSVPLRKLDIKPVQKHLVEIGNLPESVLTDQDNYEDSISALPEDIKTLPDGFKGSANLLWHPKESIPLLQKAYHESTSPETKLAYAMVLAGMYDPTGTDALLSTVKSTEHWDKGWNFRGMGQFGWASSPLDRYIMMLGRTKDSRGAVVIAELLKKLKAEDDFSHHRACYLALEWIGDKSVAPVIAEHLKKPGMTGYVHRDLDAARKWDQADPRGGVAEKSRRDSLIEIGFARALYRLGDVDGLGRKILEDYSKDLRGYFSRHANEILKNTPQNQ